MRDDLYEMFNNKFQHDVTFSEGEEEAAE